jgi:hypothetical protein
MHVLDISCKQYHDRSSMLLNIGLISRKNGQISLYIFWATNLQSAIENRDRLYTLFGIEDDRAIKSYSGMSDDGQKRIINKP